HYLDYGRADLPPMLLLHGMRDSALSWDIFARAMSEEYRVLSLDSRGHGDSDHAGPNGYRFDRYVSDIESLTDHLDLDGMIIVGHSAGGRYAWSYAVRHPDHVRALVVVDIDPDPYNPQTASDLRASVAEPASWPTQDDFFAYLKTRRVHTPEDALRKQVPAVAAQTMDGNYVWKADIRIVTEYERPDLWESWGRISCPVLLVRGRQSTLLTHETAVKMRASLPSSQIRLAELEGGGHWFYQDFPEAFEITVRWFLDDLVTARPR
ncbi:MAG: alpha/beta hydrolase, partial [Dehalococcoidia bacterium]|nr:alpha/beta hydrolase [Dehalococcoidia bacterium]